MDDSDWSTMLILWANNSDVTVTRNAYETVRCQLAVYLLEF